MEWGWGCPSGDPWGRAEGMQSEKLLRTSLPAIIFSKPAVERRWKP